MRYEVEVRNHLGKEHLFDLDMLASTTIGSCIEGLAERFGVPSKDCVVMDVTSAPWQWAEQDDDALTMDRIVHVRSLLQGG